MLLKTISFCISALLFCSQLSANTTRYQSTPSDPDCDEVLGFCTYYIANQGVDAHSLKRKAEILLNSISLPISIEFIIDRNTSITYSHPDPDIRKKVTQIFKRFDKYSEIKPVTDVFLYLDIYAVNSSHVKDYNFNLMKISRGSSSLDRDNSSASLTNLLFNGWDWQFQMDYSNINGWYRSHERYLVATEQGGFLSEIKSKNIVKLVGSSIDSLKDQSGIQLSGQVFINPDDPTNIQIENFSIINSVEVDSESSAVSKTILPPKSWNLWHNTSQILHISEKTFKSSKSGTQFLGVLGEMGDNKVKLMIAVTPFIGSNVFAKDDPNHYKFSPEEVLPSTKDQLAKELKQIFSPKALDFGVDKGSISDMFGMRPYFQLMAPPTTNTAYQDITLEIINPAITDATPKALKLQHLMKDKYILPPVNPIALKKDLVSNYTVRVYLKRKWLDKNYKGVIGAEYALEYNPTHGESTLILRKHRYLQSEPKKTFNWNFNNSDTNNDNCLHCGFTNDY